MNIMKTAIIGFGKLGNALCQKLLEKDKLSLVVSKHLLGTKEADIFSNYGVKIYNSLSQISNIPEIIFITTTDSEIQSVTSELSSSFAKSLNGKIIIHCSGINSDEILNELEKYGALTASAHPLQTFYEYSPDIFDNIFWIVQTKHFERIFPLLEEIGGKPIKVNFDEKTRAIYHASAVVASNFLNLILLFAKKLISETKLEPSVLLPLVERTLANNKINFKDSTFTPLTGPIIRSDKLTLTKHIEGIKTLPQEFYEIYSTLVLAMSKIALVNKNISNNIFTTFENINSDFS